MNEARVSDSKKNKGIATNCNKGCGIRLFLNSKQNNSYNFDVEYMRSDNSENRNEGTVRVYQKKPQLAHSIYEKQ